MKGCSASFSRAEPTRFRRWQKPTRFPVGSTPVAHSRSRPLNGCANIDFDFGTGTFRTRFFADLARSWNSSRLGEVTTAPMFPRKKIARAHDVSSLLNYRRLPGRLTTEETAVVLGFHEHDIPGLVVAKLLCPLGKPAPNAPKYYAAVEIVTLSQDRDWLSQATRELSKCWAEKNRRKKDHIKLLPGAAGADTRIGR
jgi:hypothetical protein